MLVERKEASPNHRGHPSRASSPEAPRGREWAAGWRRAVPQLLCSPKRLRRLDVLDRSVPRPRGLCVQEMTIQMENSEDREVSVSE